VGDEISPFVTVINYFVCPALTHCSAWPTRFVAIPTTYEPDLQIQQHQRISQCLLPVAGLTTSEINIFNKLEFLYGTIWPICAESAVKPQPVIQLLEPCSPCMTQWALPVHSRWSAGKDLCNAWEAGVFLHQVTFSSWRSNKTVISQVFCGLPLDLVPVSGSQ